MDNPFDDFRKKREAREEQLRREKENIERTALYKKQKFEEAYNAWNETVMALLEQLRQSAYPSYELVFEKNIWSIGEHFRDEGFLEWSGLINVSMLFNSYNEHIGFECFQYYRGNPNSTRSGLSRDELINALRKLLSKIEKGKKGH